MSRDFRRKCPNHDTRFSWGRVSGDGGSVTYRLFRRDHKRTLHVAMCRFDVDTDRREMACKLRAMRRELLERVDIIELHLLGVA